MSQIITPPPPATQEQASKNWYRAEALRKIKTELVGVYNDAEDPPTRREIINAIESIDAARRILDPRLRPEVKRVRTK